MRKILLALLLLSLLFLSGCSNYEEKYNDLQDKYDELEMKYNKINSFYYDKEEIGSSLDNIIEKLASLEDDIINVYCYFEKEFDVSFDEAYDSFDRIHSVYNSIIN